MPDLLKNLSDIFSSGANDWGSVHPVVVHFPIGLLFIAPFFVILGLICQKSAKVFYTSALILMLLGTASVFLATSTGDSAAEPLQANPAIVSTLDAHVKLGEQSKLSFTMLSGIFLLYVVFNSKLTQKFGRKMNVTAVCLFLVIYGFNLLILFNAAHYGGKLVHQHGIKSTLF